jgi:hypothetical protein
MKAITIHQPWATLIALGEKQFETRSWATRHRGLLAIHAAKKIDKELCMREPFLSVLDKHGYDVENLPTGAIVATCTLSNCFEVTGVDQRFAEISYGKRVLDGNELEFGWYEEGRYAWELLDINPVGLPIPAKGQQGLWNYLV